MIKAHDIKGDNRIDFEEFKLIFFDKDPKADSLLRTAIAQDRKNR